MCCVGNLWNWNAVDAASAISNWLCVCVYLYVFFFIHPLAKVQSKCEYHVLWSKAYISREQYELISSSVCNVSWIANDFFVLLLFSLFAQAFHERSRDQNIYIYIDTTSKNSQNKKKTPAKFILVWMQQVLPQLDTRICDSIKLLTNTLLRTDWFEDQMK